MIRLSEFKFLNKKGSSKKFPMRTASMSRQMVGAYFRLCFKNRRKTKLNNTEKF